MPLLWIFLSCLIALPAAAQAVVDGDTIKLDGTIYRLWGIDAPEANQMCGDYPAGVVATKALQMLVSMGKGVSCERKDSDRSGHVVAVCRVDGRDLGREMVRLGMAWAFTRYSQDYWSEEAKARAENIGVHAHGCMPAWEWRAERQR